MCVIECKQCTRWTEYWPWIFQIAHRWNGFTLYSMPYRVIMTLLLLASHRGTIVPHSVKLTHLDPVRVLTGIALVMNVTLLWVPTSTVLLWSHMPILSMGSCVMVSRNFDYWELCESRCRNAWNLPLIVGWGDHDCGLGWSWLWVGVVMIVGGSDHDCGWEWSWLCVGVIMIVGGSGHEIFHWAVTLLTFHCLPDVYCTSWWIS